MFAAVSVTIAEEASTLLKVNSVNSRICPSPLSLDREPIIGDYLDLVSPLLRKVWVSWMLEKISLVTEVLIEILCEGGFEPPEVVPEPKKFWVRAASSTLSSSLASGMKS